MKKIALGAILSSLIAAAPVLASNADTGTVSGIYGTHNGAVIFTTSGTRTGTIPACAIANPQRFVIDASTAAGQSAVAVLLTAYAKGKAVNVVGTGSCTIWGDTETVAYFRIVD